MDAQGKVAVGIADAVQARDIRAASKAASERYAPLEINISEQTEIPDGVVLWIAESPQRCRLTIDGSTAPSHAKRLELTLPLIAAYHSSQTFRPGRVFVNIVDECVARGLAFSADNPDYTLVPDATFLETVGYRNDRGPETVPWDERRRTALWRGATTGMLVTGNWRDLPRAKLCELALAHPEILDAGFSNVVQLPQSVAEEIESAGLIRGYMPVQEFQRYRYQIDIDGNTNSWPGLFHKLLSGSPVLKVASQFGYSQWYYNQLVPWVNFVPVSATMDDLISKIKWLMQNDEKARSIGLAGRELALSMTYEGEIERTMPLIANAMEECQQEATISVGPELMHAIYGANIFEGFKSELPEDLQGWNSNHPLFSDLIGEIRPHVVIDVGVWKGGSTIVFAETLRDCGIDATVIAVDTFLGSPEHWDRHATSFSLMEREFGRPRLYEQFLANVVHRRLCERIVPLAQTSVNAAAILAKLGVRAGLIHIDAAHERDAVLQDTTAYWEILEPGGYLIGDDYHISWPGVIEAAQQFAAWAGVEIRVKEPKWYVRKPLLATISGAAALTPSG